MHSYFNRTDRFYKFVQEHGSCNVSRQRRYHPPCYIISSCTMTATSSGQTMLSSTATPESKRGTAMLKLMFYFSSYV
uniref:Ovule protein n=1 Tax=Ascaris lumbricoides TaxID=6252 RepID=A0A0M3HSK9_ASCLU